MTGSAASSPKLPTPGRMAGSTPRWRWRARRSRRIPTMPRRGSFRRVRPDLAAAEAEKARNCERFLERARRALQLEDLDEADRQIQLAVQTGASNPEIAIVRTAVVETEGTRKGRCAGRGSRVSAGARAE